jgi:hypothetical protein
VKLRRALLSAGASCPAYAVVAGSYGIRGAFHREPICERASLHWWHDIVSPLDESRPLTRIAADPSTHPALVAGRNVMADPDR